MAKRHCLAALLLGAAAVGGGAAASTCSLDACSSEAVVLVEDGDAASFCALDATDRACVAASGCMASVEVINVHCECDSGAKLFDDAALATDIDAGALYCSGDELCRSAVMLALMAVAPAGTSADDVVSALVDECIDHSFSYRCHQTQAG